VLRPQSFFGNRQPAPSELNAFRIVASVITDGDKVEERVGKLWIFRPAPALLHLKRLLSGRERFRVFARVNESGGFRQKPARLVQQTILLGGGARFGQTNLVAPGREFRVLRLI